MGDSLSASDLVALMGDKDNNFNENGMWFLILIILLGGGIGGFGGNNLANSDLVTQSELSAGLNNQAIQSQLNQMSTDNANSNFQIAQMFNDQTNTFMQMNNANQINAIQGFNNVNDNIMTQGFNITNAINNLGAQMNECCCEIKTQMLQDKYEATQNQLQAAQAQLSNNLQSQYLLSQAGRFVAWDPAGTQGYSGGAAH